MTAAAPHVLTRRDACRACPKATRSRLGGEVGVTLNDRCRACRGRRIRSILVDPDFACPLGKFGRAVTLTNDRVELRIENRRLVGAAWKPKLATPAFNNQPRIEKPRRRVSENEKVGCSGCGADRASNDDLADLE